MSSVFPVKNNNYQKLTHISLCITEFIDLQCLYMCRFMETSSGDTLTNLLLLNYASYMDPYVALVIVRYYKLENMVCFYVH
jgi:hypothetical protein